MVGFFQKEQVEPTQEEPSADLELVSMENDAIRSWVDAHLGVSASTRVPEESSCQLDENHIDGTYLISASQQPQSGMEHGSDTPSLPAEPTFFQSCKHEARPYGSSIQAAQADAAFLLPCVAPESTRHDQPSQQPTKEVVSSSVSALAAVQEPSINSIDDDAALAPVTSKDGHVEETASIATSLLTTAVTPTRSSAHMERVAARIVVTSSPICAQLNNSKDASKDAGQISALTAQPSAQTSTETAQASEGRRRKITFGNSLPRPVDM